VQVARMRPECHWDRVISEYFGFPLSITWSRDRSAGISTRYGLDGPGIEFWWGRDFPHPSILALDPT
jgi:hypothetical protein